MISNHIYIEPVTQRLVLGSKLKSVVSVDKLIADVKKEFSLSESNCNDIWVVLNEAVSNAIKHGNSFSKTKKVIISLEVKENRYLCFNVKDEGDGFDFENVPDPTHPSRIHEPNGRGIFLMRKLSHGVNFTEKGKSVEMIFDLSKLKSKA